MIAETTNVIRSAERLEALRHTGLLDNPPEPGFDRLTRLAARLLQAPIALISLVDAGRLFFASAVGLPEPWASRREMPLSHGFCLDVINAGQPLIVEDARRHLRRRKYPALVDLGFVAYLGIPLVTASGQGLGSLSVLDRQPRSWTPGDVEALTDLAALVMTEIDRRAGARHIERERHEKAALFASLDVGICLVDAAGRCTLLNQAAADILGYAVDEVIGRDIHRLWHESGNDAPPCSGSGRCPALLAMTGQHVRGELEELWRRDGTAVSIEYAISPIVEDGVGHGTITVVTDITKRLSAQRALRESEARFRRIFDSGMVGMHFWDSDGRIIEANDAYLHILGYTREDLYAGRINWKGMTPPELLDLSDRALAEVAATGACTPFEKVYIRHDGTTVPVLIGLARLDEYVHKGVGFLLDLSDRKQAEHDLQLARQALDATSTGIVICSADHERECPILYVNRAYQRMTGYALDELLGQPSRILQSDETDPAVRARIREALLTERECQVIVRARRKDSAPFWGDLHIAPVRDEAGRVTHFIGAQNDVTERQAAAERLRILAAASEYLGASLDYAAALDRVADLIVPDLADWWAVDIIDEPGAPPHLAAIRGNPAREAWSTTMEHISTAYWIGEADVAAMIDGEHGYLYTDLAAEPPGGGVSHYVAMLRRAGATAAMVVPIVSRDRLLGVMTVVSAGASHRYGPDDLMLAEDLARRTGQAVDNARLYQQVQDALRTRNEFFSSLTHDLKMPLTSILGYAHVMRRRLGTDEQAVMQRKWLEHIETTATKMVGQINQLLDLARLQTGHGLELQRDVIDLAGLIEDVVAEHRAMTDAHRLHLAAEDDLIGEWDGARLSRMLDNLLSNAIKYSPEGGDIEVTLRREDADGQVWAVVRLTDHGIGIPAADLPHIFEPFHRAANARDHFTGSGIGLMSARQIIELHGGTIAIESVEGQGTTATVRLPCER